MTSQRFIIIVITIYELFCGLCSSIIVFAEETPTVRVKNGTLEGTIMMSRNGKELLAFRGIPYAQPPIGELRFEPPKPFGAWTGVRSAKEHGNMCIQRDTFKFGDEIEGAEDCLYLNVYRPKLPPNATDRFQTNFPVLIYIHGGGWLMGSSDSKLYGPKYLLDHDIILVTLNYRLGPFGFFSTEDLVSPGNQGLKDTVQAVRWVNENIAVFSGDPNRITIAGHSAGAASVHYLTISPLSRGLFHRTITHGGGALNAWAISGSGVARQRANEVGKLLNCPTGNSSALIECLKEKDAADIIPPDYLFKVFDPPIRFQPAVEPDHPGAFIKEEPVQSLKAGKMADVPWLTGINLHDGSLTVLNILGSKDKQYDKLLDANFMEIAPLSLLYDHMCPEKLKDNVTKSIREFYLGDERIDESKKWSLIDMYSDAWFFIGVDNAIRYHFETVSSPIYYNVFGYKGSFSYCGGFENAEGDYGVAHGDDVQYIFPQGEKIFSNVLSKQDGEVVDIITRFWANFVKSGNPTPERTSDNSLKWKPVRTSKLEYLYVGNSKEIYMADNLFRDRVNFWANIPLRGNIVINDTDHHIKDEL